MMNSLELALDYLARHMWQRYIFPVAALKKFPPLLKDNLETNCSNDPKQIIAWSKKFPGCNWGVAHRRSGLLVADIDTNKSKGKVGAETFALLELTEGWPDTEIVTTPSGGHHHYYDGWADDNHPAHIMALGENGVGNSIDFPNYVLIPGCTFADGTSYTTNDADAVECPEWIYNTIKSAKTKSRITDAGEVVVELDQAANVELAIDFLRNDAVPAIEGSGGDFNTLKTAMYLKDLGVSPALAVDLLNEYYNPRCVPPWDREDLERKVENAFNYASQSKTGGKTAEADFADDPPPPITPMGNKKKIRAQKAERKKARAIATSRPDDPSRAKTKDQIIDQWVWIVGMERFINKVDPKGNYDRDIWKKSMFDSEFNRYVCPKRGSASDILFRQKKGGLASYYRPSFKPGQPQSLDDGQTFNMYRTPDIEPIEGDISWWNEHLEYLLPDEVSRNHLLNWMAWLLQNLKKKPKHALILQGEVNGTGKSFIGKVLTRILHQANVSVVPQNGLSNHFNSWALQCKLIVVEELRASDKGAVKEALHDIITEDIISIEKKGVDPIKIENCFGIFALTNDVAALTLDNTDRRYLVLRTDRTQAEADEKKANGYFGRLFAQLEDDRAMAAVMYSLVNRDVTGYNGQASAPMTDAKVGMQEASMTNLEHHLRSENCAVSGARIVNVEDISAGLPRHLSHGTRTSTIISLLKRDYGAIELGQCTTPNGKRPRLYAIGPQAAFIAQQTRAFAGKCYEDDKKRGGVGQSLSNLDDDASSEFGDPQE